MDIIKRIIKTYRDIEKYLLVLMLSIMSIFAIGQIILRKFFQAIPMLDTLSNYLVIWVTMIAAGIVTYEAGHIKIDLIGRFAKGRVKLVVYAFISLFGALVCSFFVALFTSYLYAIEYVDKGGAIWSTLAYVILPLGFFGMSVRMYCMMMADISELVKPRMLEFSYVIKTPVLSFVIAVIMFLMNINYPNNVEQFSLIGSRGVYIAVASLALLSALLGVLATINVFTKKMSFTTPLFASYNGVFYLGLWVFSIVRISAITTDIKVHKTIGFITDSQMNVWYFLPVVFFFVAIVSLLFPVMDKLRDIYPAIDDESTEEAV